MNNYLNNIQDILNWLEVGNLGVWFVLNDDTQNNQYTIIIIFNIPTE